MLAQRDIPKYRVLFIASAVKFDDLALESRVWIFAPEIVFTFGIIFKNFFPYLTNARKVTHRKAGCWK